MAKSGHDSEIFNFRVTGGKNIWNIKISFLRKTLRQSPTFPGSPKRQREGENLKWCGSYGKKRKGRIESLAYETARLY